MIIGDVNERTQYNRGKAGVFEYRMMNLKSHEDKVPIERYSPRHNKLKALFWVGLMLSPGIFLDAVYYGYVNCEWIMQLFHSLSDITGVTYQGALGILGSTVGVVMTMVNLFLATGISLAQRKGEHVYGISRSELEEFYTKRYRGTRNVSLIIPFIAPVLIIVFLNCSMCITGYLLYLYCYFSYFTYYRMHEQSYNKERNQSAVVEKILAEYQRGTESGRLAVQVIFEKMRNGVVKENNWNEMGIIYRKFMGKFPQDDLYGAYNLSSEFFHILFFHGPQIHEIGAQKFVREFIRDFDGKSHSNISDIEWVKLFAILEIAVMDMDEVNLISFLNWIQNYKIRKEESMQQGGSEMDSHTIQMQRVMVCVFLECRFQNVSPRAITLPMAKIAKESWYAINTSDCLEQLKAYSDFAFHHPMINLKEIIRNMRKDYKEGTRVSIIANIATNMQ